MKKGQPFNISKVEAMVKIPLIMIKNRALSFATKMTYALLIKHSGSAGYCSVSQKKLAAEMGVSLKLIRKAVSVLKKEEYIKSVPAGHGRPSRYYFLWREEFYVKKKDLPNIKIDPELHTMMLRGPDRTKRVNASKLAKAKKV